MRTHSKTVRPFSACRRPRWKRASARAPRSPANSPRRCERGADTCRRMLRACGSRHARPRILQLAPEPRIRRDRLGECEGDRVPFVGRFRAARAHVLLALEPEPRVAVEAVARAAGIG